MPITSVRSVGAVMKQEKDDTARSLASKNCDTHTLNSGTIVISVCAMDGKPLPKGRRRYCSAKCSNRAAWVAKYGLSPEDYTTLLGDSKCVICGRNMRKVNVDHDHKTGVVRGLVCGLCNKRVLTSIHTPIQAFRLLKYLLDNPGKMLLNGEPRIVGAEIVKRDAKPRRRRY